MQDLQTYLGAPLECACGQTHQVPIEQVVIGAHAYVALCTFIRERGYHQVLIVEDVHTREQAGNRIHTLLTQWLGEEHVQAVRFALPEGEHLAADQAATARAESAVRDTHADLVVAVGSGTITDIARYASFCAGRPFISVPTAPSVDGYASTVAALTFDGLKVTKSAHAPIGVFADVLVLAQAPMALIQAGVGDLLGKVTSLLDWKLAAYLYGEHWCEAAYNLVVEPLIYCIRHAESLVSREPESVLQLFLGLLSSGVAMSMVGNSRPASGCEHHCSHYWDFLAYRGMRGYTSHGVQVGYATHFTMHLYEQLSSLQRINEPQPLRLDELWRADISKRFGSGAQGVLTEQTAKVEWLRTQTEKHNLAQVQIGDLLAHLEPEMALMASAHVALESMQIPDRADFLEITPVLLEETLVHAREVRTRYTVMDFLEGQGVLRSFAARVVTTASAK